MERPREPRCWSRHYCRDPRERPAAAAKLPTGERFGWHSLRRRFASELKDTNLKDPAVLGGWKHPRTILACYMQPDEGAQRAALAKRRELRHEVISGAE